MNGEWCYYKSHFTSEECNLILQDSSILHTQDAKLGVDGSSDYQDYRKSKTKFIKKQDQQFQWLFDRMWKLAIESNDIWFNFHISKMDYIQLAEYDSAYKGEYKKHHDVFWMNNDPIYHRKLTAIIQLTDPTSYDGGNFEMCNVSEHPNSDEVRAQGTVFFFPSFLEHQATPVTSGVRYSLACWFDGPKWR